MDAITLIARYKDEYGRTKKSLGQHFLNNRHYIDQIAISALSCGNNNIVEIGPGCGSLTSALLSKGANVCAIEIDAYAVQFLQTHLASYENLQITDNDATRIDYSALPFEKYTIVGNLPYNVGVSIFSRFSKFTDNISSAVLMFQKEVADRISAKPCTKQYGSLSVFASYHYDIAKVMDISGSNFWPKTKVRSTVLKFSPKPKKYQPDTEEEFFSFVRQSFGMKRKTLRNNLINTYSIEEAINLSNLNEKVRAEELSLDDFFKVFEHVNRI